MSVTHRTLCAVRRSRFSAFDSCRHAWLPVLFIPQQGSWLCRHAPRWDMTPAMTMWDR